MIKIKCENCNQNILIYKHELKSKHYFCNQKCYGEWLSKNNIGINNKNYKKRIKTKCSWCNKFIFISEYLYNRSVNNFCNKNCHALWNSKHIRGKNHPNYKKKIKAKCALCKKLINVYPYKIKQKQLFFCNISCKKHWQSIFMLGKNNPFYGKKHTDVTKNKLSQILGGTGVPYENTEYGNGFDDNKKEQIRFRDKYKCRKCGCTQLENGKQLDVHHIDYDKKNNIITNLISLCIRCHRKTNTNRKYWTMFLKNIIKTIYQKVIA